MSFARVYSAQTNMLTGEIIGVEIDTARGLNAFSVVGLPDKAVEESRDRVGSALKNSGFDSPKHSQIKTIVSLTPAETKKEGAFFDLGIAIGFLLATEQVKFESDNKVFIGELSLAGELLLPFRVQITPTGSLGKFDCVDLNIALEASIM